MVKIPKEVLDLLNQKETVKILVTADKEGQPHAIVCGSIGVLDENTVTAGEVFMKRSSKNMNENKKTAILITQGPKAYEMQTTVLGREDSGKNLESLNKALSAVNLKAKAVWKFKVDAVYDEGAGPNCGTKIA